MGRRSSRPSPPRRRMAPSPPRRASSSAAPSSASKQKSTAPAPTDASKNAPPPVPAAAAPSAGGGFMANIASTAAGVAIGRGIDRALFGGGGSGAAATEASPDDHLETSASAQQSSSFAADGAIPESVCSREILEFRKCLDRSNHQLSECQWNLDLLKACQEQAQAMGTGFADAPRF